MLSSRLRSGGLDSKRETERLKKALYDLSVGDDWRVVWWSLAASILLPASCSEGLLCSDGSPSAVFSFASGQEALERVACASLGQLLRTYMNPSSAYTTCSYLVGGGGGGGRQREDIQVLTLQRCTTLEQLYKAICTYMYPVTKETMFSQAFHTVLFEQGFLGIGLYILYSPHFQGMHWWYVRISPSSVI